MSERQVDEVWAVADGDSALRGSDEEDDDEEIWREQTRKGDGQIECHYTQRNSLRDKQHLKNEQSLEQNY